MSAQILTGDAMTMLRTLPDGAAQACVTSPPYWGLRDYGVDGQIGLEQTPEQYVARLVDVFREVRRVLRDDGTLWLNLGDSYAATSKGTGGTKASGLNAKRDENGWLAADRKSQPIMKSVRMDYGCLGLKPKDLVGIPWLVAFALRADGWYLRSDIIWSKPNPMPESVRDRPTKAHEYLFLLSKSERYRYDADAIADPLLHPEASTPDDIGRAFSRRRAAVPTPRQDALESETSTTSAPSTRNRRTVWTVPTHPFSGAHFATMPPKLVEPCVLAGSRHGDTVLDPFAGAGTTGLVALRHGRSFIGCELNPEYAEIARSRIHGDAPLLHAVEVLA